ncbi:Uma2 family endonuclease [Streptomyces sp. PTM05]|uniref:Uma2 family endonuclease n=1 Tax=Streptantibioticus parmotrematis TaxID=2873249 RepID=A0ABS7QNF1_9ACTN|nr:Uma2 family endonuclease [Streptantibioticus parmotrematis]MBY8883950.1 Uma2 family endonuclease [Streptantibioticus parmotrematis]
MSALPIEPPQDDGYSWDELVGIWATMDHPEGCKVEIIDGSITVTPSPANQHSSIVFKLLRMLVKAIPDELGVYTTLDVAVPAYGNLYVPDLVVIPEDVVDHTPGHYVAADQVLLAIEVTSPSNARRDRITKLAGYATGGVPLYLLVDRWAPGGPLVTLFGEPEEHTYKTLQTAKFGDQVHLPAPFDLTIDTGAFPGS